MIKSRQSKGVVLIDGGMNEQSAAIGKQLGWGSTSSERWKVFTSRAFLRYSACNVKAWPESQSGLA